MFLEGHLSGETELSQLHLSPRWWHAGSQQAAGTSKPGMRWKAERMRCSWRVGGVTVCGTEVGLVSPAFCRVNTMDPHLLCICVLVYFHACVTLQKLSYPENCTSPRIHHLLHELSPSTLLLQINTHIHTQHPPPGVQQELALGDYREEKKLSGGQSSASLLL